MQPSTSFTAMEYFHFSGVILALCIIQKQELQHSHNPAHEIALTSRFPASDSRITLLCPLLEFGNKYLVYFSCVSFPHVQTGYMFLSA